MRIGLGQINSVVGDLAGNCEKMRSLYAKAVEKDVDLLVFPELSICGYPPEDLLHKKHFLADNLKAVKAIAEDCCDKILVVGFAESSDRDNYNSAAVLEAGEIKTIYRKVLLPNYGVFDERRYFKPGDRPVVINVKGVRVAVSICADIWNVVWMKDFLKKAGTIDVILNISASPFDLGKTKRREEVLGKCAREFQSAVCYCNLVGGQDELVFDGRSMVLGTGGEIIYQAKAFDEDLLIADINVAARGAVEINAPENAKVQKLELLDEVYQALVLGTRDYAKKNGFKKVLLGLSGGIDSALVAAIATAALGAENVIGITMPSKFNSPETIADAKLLAENLGIEFLTVAIESVLEVFDETLLSVAGWDNKSVAYENLQARIRGTILMSLSNQFGSLVLTTGNKSETAVGYATLYGDTAGGFAMIKDVPKTMVYKLAEYINVKNGREVIPADVITRAPSAELRAEQKDSDSLPEYDLLDTILKGYVEEDKSAQQLIETGLDRDLVVRVIGMVDRNEYKRRQSPPGVKITAKAFGRDRRLPITNRYNSCDDSSV